MAAVARRFVDTTIRGVHLSSRYDKPREIEHMQRIVERMDIRLLCHIESIWCDSKVSAFYFIDLKSSTPIDRAPWDRLPEEIAQALASAGGYNGVRVSIDNKEFDFGPSWPDEDFGHSE